MKKVFLFLLFFTPSFSFADEVYYCDPLKGWFLDENTSSPEKTGAWDKNGCSYVIDDKKMVIVCGGVPYDNCLVINRDIEKTEVICMAHAATELYTFSKSEKKLFYVKNAIHGGKGYSIAMFGNCK